MPLDQILPNDLRAPREARQAIAQFLTGAGVPDLIDDAQLLASELVTNAVRYARGPIAVRAYIRDGFLHLEVCDAAADCAPRPRTADADDEGGRGMELIEKLSTRWGWRITEHSKIVWLDLRV